MRVTLHILESPGFFKWADEQKTLQHLLQIVDLQGEYWFCGTRKLFCGKRVLITDVVNHSRIKLSSLGIDVTFRWNVFLFLITLNSSAILLLGTFEHLAVSQFTPNWHPITRRFLTTCPCCFGYSNLMGWITYISILKFWVNLFLWGFPLYLSAPPPDLIVLTLSFPSWSLNSYWLGSPKSKLTHRPAGCAAFSKILFSLRLKQLQWRGSALMFWCQIVDYGSRRFASWILLRCSDLSYISVFSLRLRCSNLFVNGSGRSSDTKRHRSQRIGERR